ncbi:hypothetical protein F511_26096 [Dorcoceras hygrometricum]|uniref:Uncharacterized protein n=1 Tax=Dorcoceras hygrometricum TaxID=472368 RepID=A0A2Z7CFJ3_9LAMI|nr:hypothetical protein F511_26096 [Dorcoceras hygrometricum]
MSMRVKVPIAWGNDVVVLVSAKGFSSCVYCLLLRAYTHYITCISDLSRMDARESGDTALSSPYWDFLALMRRVVNYHSLCYPPGRGANPAGGAPGGG